MGILKRNCMRTTVFQMKMVSALWCGGVDAAWEKKANERRKKMEKQEHLAKKRKELYEKSWEQLDKIHEESKAAAVSEMEKETQQNRWRKVVILCFRHLRHVPGDQQ